MHSSCNITLVAVFCYSTVLYCTPKRKEYNKFKNNFCAALRVMVRDLALLTLQASSIDCQIDRAFVVFSGYFNALCLNFSAGNKKCYEKSKS